MIRYATVFGVCLTGCAAFAQDTTSTNLPPSTQIPQGAYFDNNTPVGASDTNSVATNLPPAASIPILPAPGMSPLPPSAAGAIPLAPPQVGPGSVGSPVLQSPIFGTSQFSTPPGLMSSVSGTPGIPVWGPIDVHPHLQYTYLYATGIQSAQGDTKGSSVSTVYPGLLFDLGPVWTLDYTPSYTIYSDPTLGNTLGQSILLNGNTTFGDWGFHLSQSYFTSDQPLVQTGTQTSQDLYDTELGLGYQLNSKVTLQFGASQTLRYASQFNDVESWNGFSGFNYQIVPQLGVGLDFTGGYANVSDGSAMPSEQLQATMNFHPGPKLALAVSGGAEYLQFVDPSAPPLLTPTFGATAQYQLFSATAFSISASRSVSPSYFGNTVQISSTVGAALQQRLSRKWSATLSAGYISQPLTSIVPSVAPRYFVGVAPTTYLQQSVAQNSSSIGLSLAYACTTRISAAAYWTELENSASQAVLKSTSTQIGFSLSYQY